MLHEAVGTHRANKVNGELGCNRGGVKTPLQGGGKSMINAIFFNAEWG